MRRTLDNVLQVSGILIAGWVDTAETRLEIWLQCVRKRDRAPVFLQPLSPPQGIMDTLEQELLGCQYIMLSQPEGVEEVALSRIVWHFCLMSY